MERLKKQGEIENINKDIDDKLLGSSNFQTRNSKFQILTSHCSGITLIALVVTIVVLLILAGVTINLILAEGGLFDRAQGASDAQKKAEVEDKVGSILADALVEKSVYGTPLKEYLEKENIPIVAEDDETITIEVDGYTVVIDKETYEIISIDKNGKSVRINLSSNTAKVNEEITAEIDVGTELTILGWTYVTDETLGTDEANYPNDYENPIKLTASTEGIYYLHVLVVDKDGNKAEKVSGKILIGNEITDIELSEESVVIGINEEKTLTVTITPTDAINTELTWSSSDEEVVKVAQDGKITGLKEGDAIVTVTTPNNITKECIVYVREKLYLIQNGKDNTELTGGWEGVPYYNRETGTLTFTENGYANFVGTNEATIYLKATINDIDWSGYKTLNIRIKTYNALESFSSYGSYGASVITGKSSFSNLGNINIAYASCGSSDRYVAMNKEITLSGELPNEYVDNTYIGVWVHRCYGYIYDVYLQ